MSGTVAMIISGLCFAIVHGSVKILQRIPPHELVFFRAVISSSMTFVVLRHFGFSPWGKNRKMLLLRGLLGTMALLLFFETLHSMPMASAVTIQYLHPILTVILSSYFLKERPSWQQWLFFLLSFIGVLMVRGFDERITAFGLAIGLISAFCSSCAYTMIRALRHEDHALVVVFYLPFISLIVVGPYTAFHWVTPIGSEWLLIAVIGVFTQIAHYFMTVAYRSDTAANISNLNYLGIIYALFLGISFWNEEPKLLATIGMCVIAASAIYSTRLQRKKPSRSDMIA